MVEEPTRQAEGFAVTMATVLTGDGIHFDLLVVGIVEAILLKPPQLVLLRDSRSRSQQGKKKRQSVSEGANRGTHRGRVAGRVGQGGCDSAAGRRAGVGDR